MIVTDTSRCFHYGSRPGRRRRYVVMYQYLTPFAASFPIDAGTISSKYAQALRDRGGTPSEREARLYGLVR
jgi:hypothetical protein